MRLLVLVSDAFGGRGGIAKFNRDLLEALCAHPASVEVVAVPRVIIDTPTNLPEKLRFETGAATGKISYIRTVLRAAKAQRYDGVVCGHTYLTPLAAYTARRLKVPLLLVLHGIEAWTPPPNPLARIAARRSTAVVSVSDFTRRRFAVWSAVPPGGSYVVPNCVDIERFGLGPKRRDLVERYGIADRTVLLTVGRLAGAERYKGFDEIIELLPELSRTIPSITYLIVGEGNDRHRLARKARALGVRDRVIFTGYVSERDKPDHYRLADAYVMPSHGEGFGIVHLEALACGVPVVASTADASREAVLGGVLGEVADPERPDEIASAIRRALERPRAVPQGLEYFSTAQFRRRWHAVVDEIIRPA